MTQIDYLYYQIVTGWSNIRGTFKTWVDLMRGDYKHYALLKTDDPLTECLGWFWYDLNGDELYSKEFLEYLYQLAEDVRTGKVDIYKFESFNELVEDLEDCE
jgi:hypothetical protein